MKAMVLHDQTGAVLSLVVMTSDIDLELLSDREESALEVDPNELGIGDVQELTAETGEQIRASIARAKSSLRVDVGARRLVRP